MHCGQIVERSLCPFVTFVRWRHMNAPWRRVAGTKLFKLPVKKTIEDPVLQEEVKKRTDHYEILMKSIRIYLADELAAKTALLTNQQHVEHEQKVFQQCLALNVSFNKASSEFRERRETAEKANEEERKLERLIQIDEEEKQSIEAATKQVEDVIAKSHDFVTSDTLHERIERALNERNVYNFVIDVDGRRYVEHSDGSCVAEQQPDEQQQRP